MLADIVFIVAILLMGIFISNLLPDDPAFYLPGFMTLFLGVLFIIVYVGVTLLIYTRIKLFILVQLAGKNKVKLGFWKFFSLNLILLGIVLVFLLLFTLLINVFIVAKSLVAISAILLIVFMLAFYFLLNFSHSMVIQSGSLRKILFEAWSSLFTKKILLPLIVVISSFLFVALFFGIIGFFLRGFLFGTFDNYLDYYPIYKIIFISAFYIVLYVAFFFNRYLFVDQTN